MAYNYQQVPFWDFVRAFDNNNNHGAGVDHPAEGHQEGFNHFGPPPPPPGPEGRPGPSPHPFGGFPFGGFPFGGPGFWGQGPPHHGGPGGWGGRGGRRGRHGRRREEHDEDEREHTPNGSRSRSRSHSPNGEHTGGEAREGSQGPRPRGCHGHHRHHGPRGFGHHGRGRGGCGAWGGRGGYRGPPPFGGPGGPGAFDMSALFESLSHHPLAQAFRAWADAQRSGETLVPEDADAENSFIPPIDIFSTEKEYILHVALPGAKKEDVGVNWDAEKGLLNLAGVVYRQGDEEFLKTLSKSERKVGVFERMVKLPPGEEEKEEIDGDAITAKLEDGVLVVTVPKIEKEWTEVKKVDIE